MIKSRGESESLGNEETWPWLGREDFGQAIVIRLKLDPDVREDAIRTCFQMLFQLAHHQDRRPVLLNLEATNSLASRTLEILVRLSRRFRSTGRLLALCGLSPQIKESLEATYLISFFQVYPIEREALLSLAAAAQGSE